LVAAAYRTAASEEEWLDALAKRAVQVMGAHAGVYAYSYRFDEFGAICLGEVATCGASAAYWSALERWGAENTASIARLYRTQVLTLGEAVDRARALCLPMSDPIGPFRAHGVTDLLIVMGQAGGAGVILTAPWRVQVGVVVAQRRSLERLASELAVAQRARSFRSPAKSNLSRREQQVATALQCGMGDKAIAYSLGLSSSAVAEYTARLRRKLGCLPGEELLALHGNEKLADPSLRLRLLERLTPAEHIVACSLVTGLSHDEIARERGISSRTVASQVASVFRKVGVSGRRELVASWFGVSGK
jgi:DNA-binding NarL/FixJ family response regulator